MKLPEVRSRLEQLADEHGIPELRTLAAHTKRRYNGRAAPIVSNPVTPALAQAVQSYVSAFPDTAMHEVAKVFKINQGRVSEILHGKRT